jgi:hypothetical protein
VLAAAIGLALAGAATPGWANGYYLNVVRTSATTVKVDFVLDTIDYHATLTNTIEDWNTPEFQGVIAGLGTPNFSELFSEGAFWTDPGASSGLAHLNLIPSGNRGSTTVDINLNGNLPPFAQGGRCEVNNVAVSCPLSNNGDTWTGPVSGSGSGQINSTIAITFTDRTVVPEPAGWALMIAGVALAGASLRRRALAA